MAADFTMGIWVDTLDVAAVGVGIGFTGTYVVWVVGKGWAITLTLYLLFAVILILIFFSVILGPGAFLVNGLLFGEECWCVVVIGFGVGAWVWDQACLQF